VRCQVLDGYVYYRVTDHALRHTPYDSQDTELAVGEEFGETLQVERDKTLENIDFRFAPFKKGVWRIFTTLDGLAHGVVTDIYRDPANVMWIATEEGGISRYDGKEFVNLTIKNGLASRYSRHCAGGTAFRGSVFTGSAFQERVEY
jgi:hypothetical protein